MSNERTTLGKQKSLVRGLYGCDWTDSLRRRGGSRVSLACPPRLGGSGKTAEDVAGTITRKTAGLYDAAVAEKDARKCLPSEGGQVSPLGRLWGDWGAALYGWCSHDGSWILSVRWCVFSGSTAL